VQVDALVGRVALPPAADAVDDLHECMRIHVEAQRAVRGCGDVRQVRPVAADDDALQLVGEGRRVVGHTVARAVDRETRQPRGEADRPRRRVGADPARARVDVEAADESLPSGVVGLAMPGAGEGEEARDVQAPVVGRHRKAARLEVAVAKGAPAPGQVDVPDDAGAQRVDDRDRVLV
jgi:hypothetical protein